MPGLHRLGALYRDGEGHHGHGLAGILLPLGAAFGLLGKGGTGMAAVFMGLPRLAADEGSIVYALTQVLNVCDTLPCLHDGSRCHLPAATRGAGLLRTGLAAAQPPLFRCVAAGTASQSLSAQKLRANWPTPARAS